MGLHRLIANAAGLGYSAIADTAGKYFPPEGNDISPIFPINFWHPYKMINTGGGAAFFDTYKVSPNYIDDFDEMCFNVADVLKDSLGIDYFVLHNEPNLYWNETNGGSNWRNSAEDFAWQCNLCAQQIKSANRQAKIIFGAFAGASTLDGFIDDAVDSILAVGDENEEPPIIDAIDFHVYGDLTAYQDSLIADSLSSYCNAIAIDWTVLETSGPNYTFPVEDTLFRWQHDISIRDSLYNLRDSIPGDPEVTDVEIRDSLWQWVSEIDPDNLGLPDNWNDLADEKVDEFNERVGTFVEYGASAVHWFSAHILEFPPVVGILDWPMQGDDDIDYDSVFVDLLIRSAEDLPLNIIDRTDDYWVNDTPLSNRMREYIDSLYQSGDSRINHGIDKSLTQQSLRLYPNSPNSFNASTRIRYYLPEDSPIKIEIFNVNGQGVAILFDGVSEAGEHKLVWNASNYPSGIYFCKFSSFSESRVIKMTLLKWVYGRIYE